MPVSAHPRPRLLPCRQHLTLGLTLGSTLAQTRPAVFWSGLSGLSGLSAFSVLGPDRPRVLADGFVKNYSQLNPRNRVLAMQTL